MSIVCTGLTVLQDVWSENILLSCTNKSFIVLFHKCFIFVAGASMTSFVLLVEYSGIKHRSWAGTNLWYCSSLCFMVLSLLAYLIREWRYLMLYGAVMSVPAIVVVW